MDSQVGERRGRMAQARGRAARIPPGSCSPTMSKAARSLNATPAHRHTRGLFYERCWQEAKEQLCQPCAVTQARLTARHPLSSTPKAALCRVEGTAKSVSSSKALRSAAHGWATPNDHAQPSAPEERPQLRKIWQIKKIQVIHIPISLITEQSLRW